MGWSIICDARKGNRYGIGELVLVDRAKTTESWWTSDNVGVMMIWASRAEAYRVCRELKENRPRVVSSDVAIGILREQCMELDLFELDGDMSWDAHK